MKIKISVIIPVYNAEKYLDRCIQSVLNQTYKNIEVIIINDASKDSSSFLLKKYLEVDKRIKIIDLKENIGVSRVRNLGIFSSKGKFIFFIDSDDWLDKDTLEILYNKIKLENSDLAIGAYSKEYYKKSIPVSISSEKVKIYQGEMIKDFFRKLLGPVKEELHTAEKLDSLGTVWGKLYVKKKIIDNKIMFVDLKEIGSAEDILFNLQYIKNSQKIILINKPLYKYWKENNSALTKTYKENLIKKWENLYFYINEIIKVEKNINSEYREALQNRRCLSIIGLGLNELSTGNKKSQKQIYLEIKKILNNSKFIISYSNLKLNYFKTHWKFFYYLCKRKNAIGVYFLLIIMQLIRLKNVGRAR